MGTIFHFQGTDGGTVNELPIEFDFGLLKQHKMGGWEVAAEEEEFFSFTFKVSLLQGFPIIFFKGLKTPSNINFSGKMNFSLMKIRILIQMLNQNWIIFELKRLQSLSYMMIEPLESSVLMLNRDSNINGDMEDNGLWPKRLYQVSLKRDALSRDLICS